MTKIKSTTVIAIRHKGQVAIAADGQATMGNTVAKSNVKKIRKLQDGKIITGFAGSTTDAFTLLERFDEKLNSYGANMKRSAIELAKDWRMDRYLRRAGSDAYCSKQGRNTHIERYWGCAGTRQ
jgi:ATP-dependent HslUV protease subunit HslV